MIPYNFQLRDVRILHRMGGVGLVAWDMGLGKGPLSLLYLQRHPLLRPAVVICPATLKWNWEAEARKHIGMRSEILTGTRVQTGIFKTPKQLVIINYDILEPWMEYILGLNPQMLIVDEAQYCGSQKSTRTKLVRQLAKQIPNKLFLSGTPLVNRPAELWSILNMLQPKRFPSFVNYADRYCARKRNFWGWDVSGSSNLDELHDLLIKGDETFPPIMIRRRKVDVLKELPAKQRSVIPVEISKRKEYELALTNFLKWLQQNAPGKVRKASKAKRLVQMGYLKRLVGVLKLPSVFQWIDTFLEESDGKIILFAVHKKVITALHERYKKKCVVVDGSVTGKDRQLSINQFLNKAATRILIGNIRAAGVGWSATNVSTVAFLELDWTPGAHTQAEDRAFGINRGEKGVATSCYYLVGKDTIEEKLIKIIDQKQKVLSTVLDGGPVDNDLDILDKLAEALQEDALKLITKNPKLLKKIRRKDV